MSELTPAKQRAVLALVEHGAVTRAAKACGVTRQSIYRWMQEPEFAQVLRDASGEQVEQASRRLAALMLQAVDELEWLLGSKSEQQKRLAAEAILTHCIRLRELTELERRVTNLEQQLENKR